MQQAGLDALLVRPEIARLAARLASRPGERVNEPGVRRAAVALIVREASGGWLELFCIRRAVWQRDPWSGQVALPGGREEPGDSSLVETAIRETREETGTDLAQAGRLIGTLDDLRPRAVRLPAIVVRPFVFVAECDDRCELAAEVADAFWIPLDVLADPAVRRRARVRAGDSELEVMAYHHGEHVIWGMTERILRQFFALVQPDAEG
jgi:8-oxo-dGTP pyrophosphatase MutT (NUDIX family)